MEVNTKPCTRLNKQQQTPKLLHLPPGPGGVLCKVPWLLLLQSWGCTLFLTSGGIGAGGTDLGCARRLHPPTWEGLVGTR